VLELKEGMTVNKGSGGTTATMPLPSQTTGERDDPEPGDQQRRDLGCGRA